jgi:hypothetical protein
MTLPAVGNFQLPLHQAIEYGAIPWTVFLSLVKTKVSPIVTIRDKEASSSASTCDKNTEEMAFL